MTNEAIKDELYRLLSDVVNGNYPKRCDAQKARYKEAVKEAIKALDQETGQWKAFNHSAFHGYDEEGSGNNEN